MAGTFESVGDRFSHSHALPIGLQVEGPLADEVGKLRAQIGVDGTKHVDHQVHQVLERGVGHVELEDREFGVVLGADALVAKGAADLVDAVEAADEQAFEIELRSDAEDQLEVEGVVMRVEGLGGSSAANRMEHRCFDLEEAQVIEEASQGLHDGAARAEDFGDCRVREQIDIAFSVTLLDVLEAVPFRGRRQERFAEMLVAACAHRQRPGLGADGWPFDQDVVGEVEELEHGRVAVVEAVGPYQRLGVAVRGADHEEGATLSDHPAEQRNVGRIVSELVFERQLGAGVLVGGELDQAPPLFFDRGIASPGVRVGQHAELTEALGFAQPCLSELVFGGHFLVLCYSSRASPAFFFFFSAFIKR